MATIPSSLLIEIKEPENVEVKMLYVLVLKQLFRFGVKNIKIHGNRSVLVSLTYSPRGETLRKKLGNLPIHCVRLNLDNENDLPLLEEAIIKFQFNLGCEESVKALEDDEPQRKKIKWYEGEKDEEKKKKMNSKITILDQKIFPPKPKSPEFITVYDDDADMFCSQKFHYE